MVFEGYLKMLILQTVKDSPMSGYDLIKIISKKTGSKPSAGSIYPQLEELRKNKLVNVKPFKRKKIYNLTNAGKLHLKDLEKKKEEAMDTIVNRVRVIDHIYGENLAPFIEGIHERIKKGEFPFKEINEELIFLRRAIMDLLRKNKIEKNKSKIRLILKETTRKLNELK